MLPDYFQTNNLSVGYHIILKRLNQGVTCTCNYSQNIPIKNLSMSSFDKFSTTALSTVRRCSFTRVTVRTRCEPIQCYFSVISPVLMRTLVRTFFITLHNISSQKDIGCWLLTTSLSSKIILTLLFGCWVLMGSEKYFGILFLSSSLSSIRR